MAPPSFEWDTQKNEYNIKTHGVSFELAQEIFFDPKRIIAFDAKHSNDSEKRWFCIGLVKNDIITVRFTYRNQIIRIFGAGYWRRERKIYEEKNAVR
ncbi:MAG: BrnT family toxin [Fibrobacterota bacterium]